MATGDESAPGTWRRYAYDYLPDMFRRYWGVRFGGGLIGRLWDSITQASLDAVLGAYHQANDGPAYDGIRLLGNEMSMPQYPTETWLQYRSRLRVAWDTWAQAGDENTIINQLELAGAPGAYVFQDGTNGSWSEFNVVYAQEDHTVTDYDTIFGDGSTFGDGSLFGPAGITPAQLATYRDLIVHWKPAHWKCNFLIWEISGATAGTGHTVGEVGLLVGGEQIRTAVQV